MDGYELAARLGKQAADGIGVDLIAITGYGLPRDRERAYAAGFRAHLVKPVDMTVLLRLLSEPARVTH